MLSCPVHQGRERKERKGMKEMKEERSERRKKGGGKGSFDPKTEQSFSQYVMHMRI